MMKFAKRTFSILLALLMLAMVIPVSVYAATLKITTQPKTGYTAYGDTAKVTIKATGDGLKYTWYFKNAGASSYSKSSVTTATYSAKMTDTSKNRAVYCVAKDKKGKTVKSSTAYLRMKATITTQPKTGYTAYNGTAKATVTAKGDGLKYQWYIKNTGDSAFKKSSVTKATYTTTMNDKAKNRQAYCVVTDKYGKTAKTNTVYLRMKATITTQPKTGYTAYNGTAKATVTAKGDGLKYQWYIKNVGDSAFKKSSVTKATYTTTMNDKAKNRQAYCIVTDKYGKTAKTSTIYLRMASTITTQPKDAAVEMGATATVTVKAKGDGLKYTWYIKNAGATKFSKSSITKSTYSATMSDKVNGRQVYCIVTDKYGKSEQSKTVTLTKKNDSLTITKQPQSTSAAKGDQVGFSIIVKGGKAPYTYELQYTYGNHATWRNDIMAGVEILKMGDMAELVFQVSFAEEYRYRIVVTDAAGKQVISNVVTVEKIVNADSLEITRQPQVVQAAEGDEVYFFVEVDGGTEPYSYQWQYINDSRDYWDDFIVEGFSDTDTLFVVVEAADFSENFRYRCFITDAHGNEIISDEVWVEGGTTALAIAKQPECTTASAGDEVGFGIEVTGGVAPYTYQLKRTNLTLEGAWEDVDAEALSMGNMTTLLFRISSKSFLLQDLFCIVVTDAAGNQVSSNVVWVNEYVSDMELLTIDWQTPDQIVGVGEVAVFAVEVTGGSEPYTYQWEYMCDNFEWDIVAGSWATGAQTDTLSFTVAYDEFVYHYQYRCKITDAEGNVLYSDAVQVLEG